MAKETETKATGAAETVPVEESLIVKQKFRLVRDGARSFAKPSTRRDGNSGLRTGATWDAIEVVRSFCLQAQQLRCSSCSSVCSRLPTRRGKRQTGGEREHRTWD